MNRGTFAPRFPDPASSSWRELLDDTMKRVIDDWSSKGSAFYVNRNLRRRLSIDESLLRNGES